MPNHSDSHTLRVIRISATPVCRHYYLSLCLHNTKISTQGLIDSGAAINVLPYSLGVQLGFDWDSETRTVQLTGNLASIEAKVIIVTAEVGHFPRIRQAFAWAKTDNVSLILGQVNFFMEFDICFFRSQSTFELKPKV